MRWLWLWLPLLWLPACDGGGGSPEMLDELRQLRSSIERLAPRPAPTDLGPALAPLEKLLHTLVEDQQDLRHRQLALTGELQRWTQLVGQGLGGGPRPEVGELQARLQQLEVELQQQDKRHQEVQELLRQALENTSTRLEQFLQRLESVRPKESAPPDAPPGEAGPRDADAKKGMGAALDASWTPPPQVRGRREPWLIALLSTAVVMVAAFAWRYWRAGEQRARATVRPPEEGGASADELWAAASLLSEAVGRLKAAAPAAGSAVPVEADLAEWLRQMAAPAAGEADQREAEVVDDGVFVLDDEPDDEPNHDAADEPVQQPAEEPANPPEADATPPVAAVRSGPPADTAPQWREFELASRQPQRAAAAVEAALAGDPRVLRRPAPTVRCIGDKVQVRCCLLPHLAAAEAVQLRLSLQRLTAS